jgi:hypothetical protein
MYKPQSGVCNQLPYSTAPEGLMCKPQSGVCNQLPYNTAPEGLMRPNIPPEKAAVLITAILIAARRSGTLPQEQF